MKEACSRIPVVGAGGSSGGGLTDAELRASPVYVTADTWEMHGADRECEGALVTAPSDGDIIVSYSLAPPTYGNACHVQCNYASNEATDAGGMVHLCVMDSTLTTVKQSLAYGRATGGSWEVRDLYVEASDMLALVKIGDATAATDYGASISTQQANSI